jgi:hypothetical protein
MLTRLLPAMLVILHTFGPRMAVAADETGWRLQHVDEETQTQVFLRDRGHEVAEFRAVTHMKVRLSSLVAVLLDTDSMPAWVYRTRHVARLDGSSATHGVSQVITSMPWPLRDREAIVEWTLSQDPQSRAVTIEGRSAADKLAPTDGLQRMPSFESSWRFVPQPGGEVEIRFEGHGDPGGNLSLPVLRTFVDAAVAEAPLRTVIALRKWATRPDYERATYPFIREPSN